jgi:hypothetical protein
MTSYFGWIRRYLCIHDEADDLILCKQCSLSFGCHFEFSFKRTVLRANDLRNLRMAPQFADEEWKGWHIFGSLIDTINQQSMVLF